MRTTLLSLSLAAALAASTGALAQRHDEKPHGVSKQAAKKATEPRSAMPGRHDERPHGPAKAQNKDKEKAAKK